MAGYISEFNYYGDSNLEFIEVALPQGTDPSDYTVTIYDYNGNVVNSFSLGTSVATIAGQDVYLIDSSSPGFPTADPTGNLYPDDAISLDDGTSVVQFISYWGNTVTATEGPANGLTSTDVGTITTGESLQSDNGGTSYYEQSTDNPGSIPACYAPGTLIETVDGPRAVEQLMVGDLVLDETGKPHPIRWIWSGTEALEPDNDSKAPVLISQGALGPGCPARDLIVSGQHRILLNNQDVYDLLQSAVFFPAKALTVLPGIRFMLGKRVIEWWHFACDRHLVITAEGALSESLLLGPMVVRSLNHRQRLQVTRVFGRNETADGAPLNGAPAYPCMCAGQALKLLNATPRPQFQIA